MNQSERISEVVAEMNRDREREAAATTRKHIETIIDLNKQISTLQQKLSEAKLALASVTYEPVNAADLV